MRKLAFFRIVYKSYTNWYLCGYTYIHLKLINGFVIKIVLENCFKELLLLKIYIEFSLFDYIYLFVLRIQHHLLDREALSQSPIVNLFQLELLIEKVCIIWIVNSYYNFVTCWCTSSYKQAFFNVFLLDHPLGESRPFLGFF